MSVASMSPSSPQYLGLGSDNRWYLFNGGSVRSVYSNALLATTMSSEEGVGTLLKEKLQVHPPVWKKTGESVWATESGAETLAWACQVPPLHELGKEWQVLRMHRNRQHMVFMLNCAIFTT